MIRMGNIDEGLSSLPEIFPSQISDAVFRDYIVYMGSGGDYTGAGLQLGYDTGNAFGGGGWNGNNGFAIFRERRSPHEIHLSAYTAVLSEPDRVRTNLAEYIYFNGTVDSSNTGIFADGGRIIYVFHIHEPHNQIGIHKVVQALATDGEAGDEQAGVYGFVFTGNNAFLHQVDDAIGKHFRVDTEVFVVSEALQYGVGDTADTHLEGGAVIYQGGNMPAYGEFYMAGWFDGLCIDGVVYFYGGIDL